MISLPGTDALDARLRAACDDAGITGAVLAVQHADAVVLATAGRRDAEVGAGMTADTHFPLMSIVKPMTGWLVVRAAAEGRLGLDQPVAEIVAEPFASDLTVRHLLSMTSGLGELPLEPPNGVDDHAAVSRLAATHPTAEPAGLVWSYSNTAFAVLGRVLELVHGAPWTDVMRAHLFGPLGLSAGFLDEPADVPVAAEHVSDRVRGQHRVVPGLAMRCFGAAGTLVRASAVDVLRFAAVLRGAEAAQVLEPQVIVPVSLMADRWCLGVAQFDWPGARGWGWDGIGIGVRNVLRVVPDRDLAVVLLTTGDRGRLLLREMLPRLLNDLADVGVPPLRLSPDAGAIPLTGYAGVYTREGLPPARVTEAAGVLTVVDMLGEQQLSAIDARTFLADAGDPDGPTVTFDDFGSDGAPRRFYRLGFAFSRTG